MDCLVAYSTSEDSEGEEAPAPAAFITANSAKKQKLQLLPSAKDKLGRKLKADEADDNEPSNIEKHQNRIRSFRHERGNWATFVYIPANDSILDEIPELCKEELEPFLELHTCEDFHLTLSRTVVLHYHLIDNFVEALKTRLDGVCSFTAFLGQLEVYVNAEKTRTFIGFKVESSLKLFDLLKKVDAVMLDFKLQTFYEEPSFHISFAWCLGDKYDVISAELERLSTAFAAHYQDGYTMSSVAIRELRCKIGHKFYNFKLS